MHPMNVDRQVLLPPITDPTIHAEIDRLARVYLSAGGLGMELLTVIGGKAENLLNRLPGFIRKRMDGLVHGALERSIRAASASRGVMRDRGDWFNRLTPAATGALAGVGGLPGALVELPVTVTLLLRGMLDIAVEHGLDPDSDEVRMECLRIFSTAGPFSYDDGADLGLVAARLSITGHTVQSLLTRIAPRLSVVLGQKLVAQATPVLGAVAGASINYTFARYYQQLSRVHFGLLRMERETGLPRDALVESLAMRLHEIRPDKPVNRA